MSVGFHHLFSQAPSIAALGRVALSALRAPRPGAKVPPLPGPWSEETLPPRSPELITAYLRHLGADPSRYRGMVPAFLFPQWSFPLMARTLVDLPYPLVRVINAGCRLQVHAPLPSGKPLQVRVRLDSVDDDGRRAILTTRVITGTKEVPDALEAELRALVPLKKGEGSGGTRQRPTVPADARELAFLRLRRDAGLDFALLTGDFNPIHIVPAYARAAGFRSCILHGFATMARAAVALEQGVLAGEPRLLAELDARFTRPLPLPASVGVYVRGDSVWVGDAPGGGAYLEGHFARKDQKEKLS